MGSKTAENESQGGGNAPPSSTKLNATGGEPRGVHLSRDGDGSLGDDGGDDDSDGDDNTGTLALSMNQGSDLPSVSKKKKRTRSKKNRRSDPWDKLHHHEFLFRICSLAPMVENTARVTAQETRSKSRHHLEDDAFLDDYRKAAEVHRQVRRWTQDTVRPGQSLTEIAVGIEDGVRALLDNAGLAPGDGLISGLGFPTGLSLNNCVAHYTPNPGQKDVLLNSTDVMKVDFGVHINGWIVDSAFTMSFDPTYDNLLAAVKDATNTGIKNAGIDVRISDVSAAIQEAMESYEVDIKGRTIPVKAVRDLSGHNIDQYRIHAGKSMEEGEIFAIETFGTTGRGYLRDGPGVYGYGKSPYAPKKINTHLTSAKSLYKTISENFGTIVFCRRYLERLGVDRYLAGMNYLASNDIVEVYRPLMDVEGSYSAQFEHTILLRGSCKEVISRGDDY
ncbi:uncharacterized protein N7506_010746 [Penicillium brevicompactum]|uniref:uncharacterized protein n=1 Tax=Penicillium brevicompactum TaxID=5074 RepID=UPI00253F6749|nr:uncharacterized protein N7506_010746 [Penicillium brevicompactum]KAJ5327644.1 hypothetical protein N7506_010746 [Penicillium brevicompactum]